MTPREIASRIDALHYGHERRRELCTMLAYRESDLADARDAVASLRRELDGQAEEIERLRELLRDLAICACGKYCYGCPNQFTGCDRDERLKRLGVEVEE